MSESKWLSQVSIAWPCENSIGVRDQRIVLPKVTAEFSAYLRLLVVEMQHFVLARVLSLTHSSRVVNHSKKVFSPKVKKDHGDSVLGIKVEQIERTDVEVTTLRFLNEVRRNKIYRYSKEKNCLFKHLEPIKFILQCKDQWRMHEENEEQSNSRSIIKSCPCVHFRMQFLKMLYSIEFRAMHWILKSLKQNLQTSWSLWEEFS